MYDKIYTQVICSLYLICFFLIYVCIKISLLLPLSPCVHTLYNIDQLCVITLYIKNYALF